MDVVKVWRMGTGGVLLLAQWACGSAKLECPDNSVLVGNVCRAECRDDSACFLFETCNNGRCEPKAEVGPVITHFFAREATARIGQEVEVVYEAVFADTVAVVPDVLAPTDVLQGTVTFTIQQDTTLTIIARKSDGQAQTKELTIRIQDAVDPSIERLEAQPKNCQQAVVAWSARNVDFSKPCALLLAGTGFEQCLSSDTGQVTVDVGDVVSFELTAVGQSGAKDTQMVSVTPKSVCRFELASEGISQLGDTALLSFSTRANSAVSAFALVTPEGAAVPGVGEVVRPSDSVLLFWNASGTPPFEAEEGGWLVAPTARPLTPYALAALRESPPGTFRLLDALSLSIPTRSLTRMSPRYCVFEERASFGPLEGAVTLDFVPYTQDEPAEPPGDQGGFALVPFPFGFEYFGRVYWGVLVHASGYLSFLPEAASYAPQALPDPQLPNSVVAVYWSSSTRVGRASWALVERNKRSSVVVVLEDITYGDQPLPVAWVEFLSAPEQLMISFQEDAFKGLSERLNFRAGIEDPTGEAAVGLPPCKEGLCRVESCVGETCEFPMGGQRYRFSRPSSGVVCLRE